MSNKKEDLPADLATFRDSYVELFGALPPLPAARFEFSGKVNPEFLRLAEQLRAHAFYSDVFDLKTTQLILFGMLLVERNQMGAQAHAAAARAVGRLHSTATAQGQLKIAVAKTILSAFRNTGQAIDLKKNGAARFAVGAAFNIAGLAGDTRYPCEEALRELGEDLWRVVQTVL